jgi:hypothetical protein
MLRTRTLGARMPRNSRHVIGCAPKQPSCRFKAVWMPTVRAMASAPARFPPMKKFTAVQKILGLLLMVFSVTMLPPALVALIYGDGAACPSSTRSP